MVEFESKSDIFVYIIKNLLVNHHNMAIIKGFKAMMIKDIEKCQHLAPKMTFFFRMTKMKITYVKKDDKQKIIEKCKELNQ